MFKYSKPISSVSCSSLLYIFLFTSCMAFKCIHDNINEPKRPSGTQTRSVKFQEDRNERARSPHQYEPLQIYFYGDNFNQTITINTVHNVERAFQKVKDSIEKLFQVRKRKSPYVLERTGCIQRWQYGFNKGKCSRFVNKTEICAVKDIAHAIPDRFLDSLDVYDFNSPRPIHNVSRGPGLQDANFILFITGHRSEFCSVSDVTAFGSFCRVNPKTNEPLAGIINLCPSYFGATVYPFDYYYNVILHEMFHILGFSHTLFEKFIPCEKGIYCNMPKSAIQWDTNGTARLMFPMVVERAQNHFGCYEPDFGGPMDVLTGKNNKSDTIYSSHWHRLMMYSSIMMPYFTESDKLYVDRITLAVFASTGWYHMNFEKADDFKFGEGEGCMFGMDENCENSEFICDPKRNSTGCDVDHTSIGKCVELNPALPCGVYRPKTAQNCELEETSRQFALDYKALGYSRKCIRLVDNVTDKTIDRPACLPVKCDSMFNYDVLVNLTWVPCYYSQKVSFNDVTMSCPKGKHVCTDTTIRALPQNCHSESFFISIRMDFASPDFKNMKEQHNFRNFKVTALRGIAHKMNITANYIVNASLSVFKRIYLDFVICPPDTLPPNELKKLLHDVQGFLDSSNYLQILSSKNDMIMASFSVKIDPLDVVSFSDHEGFKALLIFPIICAIFLIATGVASLLRLFLIQRPKPQNTASKENNEMT